MKKIDLKTIVKLSMGVLLSVMMFSTAGCPGESKNKNTRTNPAPGPGPNGCITNCQGVPPQSNRLGLYLANNPQLGVQIAVELFSNATTNTGFSGQGIYASGVIHVIGSIPCAFGTAVLPGPYAIVNTIQPGFTPDPFTGIINGLVLEVANGSNRMIVELNNLTRFGLTGGTYISCDGIDGFSEMMVSLKVYDTVMNGIGGYCEQSVYADLGTQGGMCN